MNETYFLSRRQRMLRLLAEQQVEIAVFGEPLTFYYLTGKMISPMERFLALVMDVETGSCTAMVPNAERETLSDTPIAIRPISDQENPVTVLRDYVRGRKLGVQMGGGYSMIYNMALSRAIFSEFGMDIADVNPLAERMRMIKDEEELRLIQRNADITDEALGLAKESILRADSLDSEISLHIFEYFWRNQASPDLFPGVLLGPVSAMPHGGACGRRVQERDVILIDFGARYRYYNADMTRTFFMGEPSQEMRRVYETVLAAQLAAIEAARPGIPCSQVDKAARDLITEAGYGPYFTHRVGHGLGLAVHEAPYMHGENEMLIEEGMVFTVEPGIYIPGVGGVRIEDDVYIDQFGAHSFNHFPKDIASIVIDK